MYLTQLSLLNLEIELLDKLNNYFSNLSLNERNNITFTEMQKKLGISDTDALDLKTKLEENSYLLGFYVIYCPECGLLIKKFNDIDEINDYDICYNCESSLLKESEYIDIRYKLNERIFPYNKNSTNNVSEKTLREYSLKNANRNNLLYHITNEEKKQFATGTRKSSEWQI